MGKRCRGTENLGKGLRGVFWSWFRKRKVECPSVQTLYENSSYLTKIGLPNQRDVFILVLRVTLIYTVQAEERGSRENKLKSCRVIVDR